MEILLLVLECLFALHPCAFCCWGLTQAITFAIQESDSWNSLSGNYPTNIVCNCFARFVEVSRTNYGFSKLNIFCSFLEIFWSLRTICSGNMRNHTDQEMKIMVNEVEADHPDANSSELLKLVKKRNLLFLILLEFHSGPCTRALLPSSSSMSYTKTQPTLKSLRTLTLNGSTSSPPCMLSFSPLEPPFLLHSAGFTRLSYTLGQEK